jgi:peptidoglycan/LPS O-acetylase OafA/YrhL
MYGALIALLLRERVINRDNIRAICMSLYIAGTAAIVGAVSLHPAALLATPSDAIWAGLGRLPFVPLFAALILQAVANNDGNCPRMLRPLSFLGYISYGLYLVHELVFRLIDSKNLLGLDGQYDRSLAALFERDITAVILSVALAYVSRRFFEAPFLRRKDVLAPASA